MPWPSKKKSFAKHDFRRFFWENHGVFMAFPHLFVCFPGKSPNVDVDDDVDASSSCCCSLRTRWPSEACHGAKWRTDGDGWLRGRLCNIYIYISSYIFIYYTITHTYIYLYTYTYYVCVYTLYVTMILSHNWGIVCKIYYWCITMRPWSWDLTNQHDDFDQWCVSGSWYDMFTPTWPANFLNYWGWPSKCYGHTLAYYVSQ